MPLPSPALPISFHPGKCHQMCELAPGRAAVDANGGRRGERGTGAMIPWIHCYDCWTEQFLEKKWLRVCLWVQGVCGGPNELRGGGGPTHATTFPRVTRALHIHAWRGRAMCVHACMHMCMQGEAQGWGCFGWGGHSEPLPGSGVAAARRGWAGSCSV